MMPREAHLSNACSQRLVASFNPFMPTVLRSTFAVRETANVERNGGHKWVKVSVVDL